MDENFSEFLSNYNDHMKNNNGEQFILTKVQILKKISEHYFNKVNIYDKISAQFPTIKMFIIKFYCKIYIEGKQVLILKSVNCHKCNHNFSHNTSATFENNIIIHKTCENHHNYDDSLPTMPVDTCCAICGEKCNGAIIMDKNLFYHKECCVTTIKNNIKDWSCAICSKLLFPNLNKHKFDYCHLKNDKSYITHVACAKNDKSNSYNKTMAHVAFNKCGICKFYVLDTKYMHNKCKNFELNRNI